MSLYDGILDEKDGSNVRDAKSDLSGWGSSFKVMQTQQLQLQNKKNNVMQPRRRTGATLAPVVDLNRGGNSDEMYFNQITGKLERRSHAPVTSPFIMSEPSAAPLLGVKDEYDPLHPNDYEEFTRRRKKEREREVEKKLEEEEKGSRENNRDDRRRSGRGQGGGNEVTSDDEAEFEKRIRKKEEEEYEREDSRSRSSRGGAAIAPPKSLIEDVVQVPENGNGGPKRELIPGSSWGMGGTVASRIMAKYGYRDGQGLGKKEQGMSIALQVEKTSKRGGKIIHEKDLNKEEAAGAPGDSNAQRTEASTNANLLKNPSKVLLLRNMVGPGEVDPDLEAETTEECTKYGKVNQCLIFEMPNVAEEEAVRIFLEFERMESAIKGVVDLNGRYFGGRMVKAGFYNLDKFRQFVLGDPVD